MAIDRSLVGHALQGLLARKQNETAALDGASATHRAALAKTAVQLAAETEAACDAFDKANAPSSPEIAASGPAGQKNPSPVTS